MLISIIIVFIGLILVGIEFFLPGILFGIFGGLCIVGGITFFATQGFSIVFTLLFFVCSVLALVAVCKFALWQIKRKRQLFLKDDQEGFIATTFMRELIGQVGVTDTDLKPSGHILINGQRIQAISDRGYIEKGIKIIVLKGQGGHLVVKEGDTK